VYFSSENKTLHAMKAQYPILLFLAFLLPFVGSSQKATHSYDLQKDVLWASPEGFDLTMDIYTPELDSDHYPVLVIFHGGGWLINDKSIMDEMSAYVASHGKYVVCNVDYRLLVDQDNTVTMDEIIEDVFGAVLWVKDHIAAYKGDPNRIIVTGDSAGGHLASTVLTLGLQLSNTGFDQPPIGFLPSYLPKGKTAEEVAAAKGLEVQAAVISYGAFDIYQIALKEGLEKPSNFFWQMGGAQPRGIFGESYTPEQDSLRYKMVSPIYNIPKSTERKLPPQLFTVGSEDNLTTPASVKAYVEQVQAAGHPATLWIHEGRPHAFMDSGKNEFLGIEFEKDAVPALEHILVFLDGVFYSN